MRRILHRHIHLLISSMILLAGVLHGGPICANNAQPISDPSNGGLPNCTELFVDISTACLVPCSSTDYFVRYCNFGDITATGAFVVIEFDSTFNINGASIPIGIQNGNALTFNLGDLPPGGCGSFSINVGLDCDVVMNQSHCAEARIYPNGTCEPPPPTWDGSFIQAKIECLGDSIYFILENTGANDMSAPSQCVIIEDDLVVMVSGFYLNSGEDTTIVLPNNGGFYHFEAGQTTGNPNGFFASANIEGCNAITTGYLVQFPNDDLTLAYESTCVENDTACHFNNKIAYPKGIGFDHKIAVDVPLQYQINFQNTSSDTVSSVVVYDTLSLFLNINSLLPGASSFDYQVEYLGNNVVKFSFENLNLPPGGYGFVKFQVDQNPDNPSCARIENWAGIDFGSFAVLTDTVFHTTNCNDITIDTSVTICNGGGYYLGTYYAQSGFATNTTNFSFGSSTLNTTINVYPGTPDETFYAMICEGDSYFFEGQYFDATGTYSFEKLDVNGCPYTVTLVLTVEENEEQIIQAYICQGGSYDFHGQNLTSPGTYSHVEPSGNCFKIEILILSVKPVSSETTTINICEGDSIVWENGTYFSDTTAVHNYTSQYGCDSTTILNLHVFPNIDLIFDAEICEGEAYLIGGNAYTASGTYTDTLASAHGCDSIVTVHLIVLSNSETFLAATICEGESYQIGNETFTLPGTYTVQLSAANGCDSLVTLVLEVQIKNATCFVTAGPDTLVCGFEFDLVGSPSPGNWEPICEVSAGLVELGNSTANSTHLTVEKCGTYFFKYSHTHLDTLVIFDSTQNVFDTIIDTCHVSDIVQIDFEDPSLSIKTVGVQIELTYNDYTCHENGGVTCSNIYPFEETVPVPIWGFDLSASCQSEIYSTTVTGEVDSCIAQEITVNIASSLSDFGPVSFGTGQEDFIQLDSNGNLVSNDILHYLDSLIGIGLDSLNGQCPDASPGCFPSPCTPEQHLDTLLLPVPIHLGGQWTYIDSNGQNQNLSDSTSILVNGEEYLVVVAPNSTTYSPVQFELWKVANDSVLVPPAFPIPLNFQWQEHWELDTVELVVLVVEPCTTTCLRGNFTTTGFGAIPSPPVFDCPPFTIIFGGTKIDLEETLVCDSNAYTVQITISGGTPPYLLTGINGSFESNSVFLSEPLALNQGYSAHVVDAEGCEKSLMGAPCRCLPFFAVSPDSLETNCVDSCLTVVGNINGFLHDFEVKWMGPSGLVSNETSALICEPGQYAFIVTDLESGCMDSSYTIVYQEMPMADAGPTMTLTCSVNSVELLGNELTGDAPISFLWTGPGITPNNQNQSTPIVSEPGTYWLRVTNPLTGCFDLDAVEISQDADMPMALILPINNLNCYEPLQVLNANTSTPLGQLAFTWTSSNGNIVSGQNTPYPTINEGGIYTVLVTNSSTGCTDMAQVIVEEDFLAVQQISAGDSLQLDCDHETQVLQGSVISGDPLLIQWETANGNLLSGGNTLEPTVDAPGIYVLTITNLSNGCTSQDQVEVKADFVVPGIQIEDPDTLDCVIESLLINASGSSSGIDILYNWSTNDGQIIAGMNGATLTVNAPGSYYLTLLDTGNGCESIDSVVIAENVVSPIANAGLDTNFSCNDTSIELDATGSSTGTTMNYTWEAIGGNIGTGQSSLTPIAETPGVYVLTITDEGNGCTAIDTVLVAAYEPVSFDLVISPDCQDKDVGSVLVENLQGQSSSYFFQLDNGQVWHDSILTDLPAGNYTLTALDLDSCTVDVDFTIEEVPNLPELNLEEGYHFCGEDDPIILDATLLANSPWVNYSWSNGVKESIIEVNKEGTYLVNISTPCELVSYDFEVVDDLKRASYFEMPNVFTPNMDNINDSYGPVTPNELESYELLIFDRWGNNIFKSIDFNNKWDGKYHGKELSSDVYIYKVNAVYSDCIGKPHRISQKGDVTLIR